MFSASPLNHVVVIDVRVCIEYQGVQLPNATKETQKKDTCIKKMVQSWLGIVLLFFVACSSEEAISIHPSETLLKQVFASGAPLELRLRSDLYGSEQWRENSATLSPEQKVRLAQAEAQLRKVETFEPRLIAAQALIDILRSRTEKAISLLDQTLETHPENLMLRNALAVSYFYQWKQQGEDLALAKSLDILAGVMEAGFRSEYAFNFALILQELHLANEATEAWQHFLKKESSQIWQSKAATYLEEMKGQSPLLENLIGEALENPDIDLGEQIALDPKAAREYGERVLLPAWARAQTTPVRQSVLNKLTELGTGLWAFNGDRSLLDEADLFRQVEPRNQEHLSEGHRLFNRGMEAYDDFDIAQSQELFRQAHQKLSQGGSVLVHRLGYYQAVNQYRLTQYEPALARLAQIQNVIPEDHLETRARILWLQGLINEFQEKPLKSIEIYQQCLELYEKIGEQRRLSGILNRLSEANFAVGHLKLAWSYNRKSQSLRKASLPNIGNYLVLAFAAELALEADLPYAASHFQNEAIAECLPLNRPRNTSLAILARAQISLYLNHQKQAVADLETVAELLPEKPESLWNQALATYFLLKAKTTSPEQALPFLEQAMDYALALELPHVTAAVFLERAKVHRALGHHQEAEADFLTGIEGCERVAEQLSGMGQIQFMDTRRKLFESMIHFQAFDLQNPLRALHFAERMRARNLFRQAAQRAPNALPTIDYQDLPAKVALINFVVTEEHLFIWCIRAEEIRFIHRPVGEAQISDKITPFMRQLQGYQPLKMHSEELFDLLLKPIAAVLQPGDSLIFIPDKQLHQIPFAALFDSSKEAYLVQSFPIARAPSIRFYQLAQARDKNRATGEEKLLLVGNPKFNPQHFPTLRDLPHAVQEVKAIAKKYQENYQLLLDEEATRETILEQAPNYSLFHFGGHAVVNRVFPESSSLILADKGTNLDQSVLKASELASLSFSKTRLVVLAACGSASGTVTPSEGPLSLARSFLAGGVSAVLASPGDVPDRYSSLFFNEFYRHLADGSDALLALQQTQMSLLTREQTTLAHPATWAGFQLIGGVSQASHLQKN